MPKTKTDKRSRLIQTAVKLAYRHGFRTTSLADIAEAANVPVGNVYYYFKTKDKIGEAIVEQRLLELRTLQEQWDQRGSPKERLLACIENTFENRDLLARGGCAVGTLCSELHKEGGPLAKKSTALELVTVLKCVVSLESAAVIASVAAPASSGVGASMITSMIWKRRNSWWTKCGRRRTTRISSIRCAGADGD